MTRSDRHAMRWPVAAGALLAGAAVALSAFASHGVDGPARGSLLLAAAFAFGHGVALVALAAASRSRLASVASVALLLGTLLFSGALVARSMFGLSSAPAPLGGGLVLLGWLLHAAVALRR